MGKNIKGLAGSTIFNQKMIEDKDITHWMPIDKPITE